MAPTSHRHVRRYVSSRAVLAILLVGGLMLLTGLSSAWCATQDDQVVLRASDGQAAAVFDGGGSLSLASVFEENASVVQTSSEEWLLRNADDLLAAVRLTDDGVTTGTGWMRIRGSLFLVDGGAVPSTVSLVFAVRDALGAQVAGIDTLGNLWLTGALETADPTPAALPGAPDRYEEAVQTFVVDAGGTGPFTYQWLKDGQVMADGERVSGSASESLTVSGLTEADEGAYACLVTNLYGAASSSAATLLVRSAPRLDSFSASPSGGAVGLSFGVSWVEGVDFAEGVVVHRAPLGSSDFSVVAVGDTGETIVAPSDSLVSVMDYGASDRVAPDTPSSPASRSEAVPAAGQVNTRSIQINWDEPSDTGSSYLHFVEGLNGHGLSSNLLPVGATFEPQELGSALPASTPDVVFLMLHDGIGTATVVAETDNSSSGTQCLRLEGGVGASPATAICYVTSSPLGLSGWIHASARYRADAAGATLRLCFSNTASPESPSSATWYELDSVAGEASGTWQTVELCAAVPTSATVLKIAVDNAGNTAVGAAEWDDIALHNALQSDVGATVSSYYLEVSGSSVPTTTTGVWRQREYVSASGVAMSHTFTGLPDGALYTHVQAIDVSGNRSGWLTYGPWTIDATPPPVPVLTAVSSAGALDARYVRGSFDVTGRVPVVSGSSGESITVTIYAQNASTGAVSALQSVQVDQTQSESFTVSCSLGVDGAHRFYAVSSDSPYGNQSGSSNRITRIVDTQAPTFAGLHEIVPMRGTGASTSGTALLVLAGASDNLLDSSDIGYQLLSTTDSTIDTETDEYATYSASDLGVTASGTTRTYQLAGLSRTQTRRWGMRAFDLAGNYSGVGSVRITYGVGDDFSASWQVSDYVLATTVTLVFSPGEGTLSDADMMVGGSHIGSSAYAHRWVDFRSSVTLPLRLVGGSIKNAFAQVRDAEGNYSFAALLEAQVAEPVTLTRIDLIDTETGESLARSTTLGATETKQATLVGYDQFGNVFSPFDGSAFSWVDKNNEKGYLDIEAAGANEADYTFTGAKIGGPVVVTIAQIGNSDLSTVRYFQTKGAGELDAIDILPLGDIIVPSGGQVQLSAHGVDAAGNTVPIEAVWYSGRVGLIKNGLFQAVVTNDVTSDTIYVYDNSTVAVSSVANWAQKGSSANRAALDVAKSSLDAGSILGRKAIVVDGRAPLVSYVSIDGVPDPAPTLMAGTTYDLQIVVPTTSPDWEEALPATYDLFLDGQHFLGRVTQDISGVAELEPVVAFDPAGYGDGTHVFSVVTRDAMGNTNAAIPYVQALTIDGAGSPQTALEWMLVHQNLSLSLNTERGSWTSFGRNASSDLTREPEETASASVYETATALTTLLDYDTDHLSSGTNPSVGRRITVGEAQECAATYLYTAVAQDIVLNPLSRLNACEAIVLAHRAGVSVSLRDLETGLETVVADPVALAQETADAARQAFDEGYATTDENLSSRLATLAYVRLQTLLSSDPAADLSVQNGIDGLLEYLSGRFAVSQETGALEWVSDTEGWALNTQDYWNANRSVFVAAEVLRGLGAALVAGGPTDSINSLADKVEAFLASRTASDVQEGQMAWGDPVTQYGGDTVTTPSVASTALAVLGLMDSGQYDLTAARPGMVFLRDMQESDASWRGRAFETALSMRLVRPDLRISDVTEPVYDPGSGYYAVDVTIANDGVVDATNFSVGLYDSDVSGLDPSQRLGHYLVPVEPVAWIRADDNPTTVVTLYFNWDLTRLYVMVDPQEIVPEIDEDNNAFEKVCSQKPDPAVLADDIQVGYIENDKFSAGEVGVGEDWALQFKVRNLGMGDLPDNSVTSVMFYKGNILTNPDTAVALRTVAVPVTPPLGTGGSHAYTFSGLGSSGYFPKAGTYYISVVVESSVTNELTQDNNTAVAQITVRGDDEDPPGPADLVIAGTSAISLPDQPPAAGEPFAVSVRVDNRGGTPVIDPVVDMHIGNGTIRRNVISGVLEAGASRYARFSVLLYAPGDALTFVADPDAVVRELDESNNAATVTVSIGAAASYDLAVAPQPADIRFCERRDEFDLSQWYLEVVIRNMGVSDYEPDSLATPVVVRGMVLDAVDPTVPEGIADYALPSHALSSPIVAGGQTVVSYYVPWEELYGSRSGGHFWLERNYDTNPLNDSVSCTLVWPPGTPPQENLTMLSFEATPNSGTLEDPTNPVLPVDLVCEVGNDSSEAVSDILLEITRTNVEPPVALVSRVISIPGNSILTVAFDGVSFPAGSYSLNAVVDAANKVFEADESDNDADAYVQVDDNFTRTKPDLRFDSEPEIDFWGEGASQLVVRMTVSNRASDASEIASDSGPFDIYVYDGASSGTLLASARVSQGLDGSQTCEVTLGVDPTSMQTQQVCVVLDVNSEVDEADEDNNAATASVLGVPSPELVSASFFYENAQIVWQDGWTSFGTAGWIGREDLADYRVVRFRDGLVEAEMSVEASGEISSYTLSVYALDAGSTYEYRIFARDIAGRLSLPLCIPLNASASPVLRVFHETDQTVPGLELTSGYTIECSGNGDEQVRIEVDAPGATGIDLLENGVVVPMSVDADGHAAITRTLAPGAYRFVGRPYCTISGKSVYGVPTDTFKLVMAKGIDLTGTPVEYAQGGWELSFEYLVETSTPTLYTKVPIPLSEINYLPADTPVQVSFYVYNTESTPCGSFTTKATWVFTGIEDEVEYPVVGTNTRPDGVAGNSYTTVWVGRDGPQSNVNAPFITTVDGRFLARVEIEIDCNDDVDETFEDNNSLVLSAADCNTKTDVFFVLDKSGSMGTNSRMDTTKESIKQIIQQQMSSALHRVGALAYDGGVTTISELVQPEAFPFSALADLEAGGGTSLRAGLDAVSGKMALANLRSDAAPHLVIAHDAGTDLVTAVEGILPLKRQLQEAFLLGDLAAPLTVLNIHVGSLDKFCESYYPYISRLCSEADVIVSRSGSSSTNALIKPYYTVPNGPLCGSYTEGDFVPVDYPKIKGPTKGWQYLLGATQILLPTCSDFSVDFSVDRRCRLFILRESQTTTPSWIMNGGFQWDGELYPDYTVETSENGSSSDYLCYFKDLDEDDSFTIPSLSSAIGVFVIGGHHDASKLGHYMIVGDGADGIAQAYRSAFERVCVPPASYAVPDLMAQFYDATIGGVGADGFPDGSPDIDSLGRLVGRVTNLNVAPCSGVYARFRKLHGGTVVDIDPVPDGWEELDGEYWIPVGDVQAKMSRTVEMIWDNAYDPDLSGIVLEVKSISDDETDLSNNEAVLPFVHALTTDTLPNFCWADEKLWELRDDLPGLAVSSGALIVPVPFPRGAGAEPTTNTPGLRYREDDVFYVSQDLLTENVYCPAVNICTTGTVRAVASATGQTGRIVGVIAPSGTDLVPVAGLTADGVTTMTYGVGVAVLWDAVDLALADGHDASSVTIALVVNPKDESGWIPEQTPPSPDDNMTTITLGVTYLFQNVSIDNLRLASVESDGRWLMQADVTRDLGASNYAFNTATVGFYVGTYPSCLAARLDYKSVTWADGDPAAKTVSFYYEPSGGVSPEALTVVADPFRQLNEHPVSGRYDNHASCSFEAPPSGSDNLRAGKMIMLVDDTQTTSIVFGRQGVLSLPSHYTASGESASSVTYKVRFWDGMPGFDGSVVLGDVAVVNHVDATTISVERIWDTLAESAAIGRHVLCAQIDPVDHLAATYADGTSFTTPVPLEAGVLSAAFGMEPHLANAGEVTVPWRVTVSTAVDAETTETTVIGDWLSSTSLTSLSTGLTTGPVLLTLQTTVPGQALPRFAEGDYVSLCIDHSITSIPYRVEWVDVVLPAMADGTSLSAVSFWVARDGATYFANSMHLSEDFNYGFGSVAEVDMSAARAMGDADGRVVEWTDADNLGVAVVHVLDPGDYVDIRVASAIPDGETHLVGRPVDVVVEVANSYSAHDRSFNLVALVGANATTATSVRMSGPWSAYETRTTTLTIDTRAFAAGDVPITVEAQLADDDTSNNTTDTLMTLTGSVTLSLGQPSPSPASWYEMVTLTVEAGATPGTTGSVQMWLVDESGDSLLSSSFIPANLNNVVLGSPASVPVSYELGALSAGMYRFRGDMIERSTSCTLSRALSPVFLVGDYGLDVAVATDQRYYEVNDVAEVLASVTNTGASELMDATTVTVTVQQVGAASPVSVVTRTVQDLETGATARLSSDVRALSEGVYDVFVTANHALSGQHASAACSFAVGDAGRLPGEGLEIEPPVALLRDFVNSASVTLSLGSVGRHSMRFSDPVDFMWVDNESMPFFGENLLRNGHISSDGYWYDSVGSAATRDQVGDTWWLTLSSAGTFVSQSAMPGVLDADDAIPVEPGQDYCLSFLANEADVSTPSVYIYEYAIGGDMVGPVAHLTSIEHPIASGDTYRVELPFRVSRITRYVDVVIDWQGASTLRLTDLQMNAGQVATAGHVVASDACRNLVANPGFVVDSGVDFSTHHSGLDDMMDATAGNGVPDGWVFTGGASSLSVDHADESLPGALRVLGLTTSIEMSGAEVDRIAQRHIQVSPGSALELGFWHKGTVNVMVEGYEAEPSGSSPLVDEYLFSSNWEFKTVSLSLDGTMHLLDLAFEISSGSPVQIAGVTLRRSDAEIDQWSGWVPYSEELEWRLAETQQGTYSQDGMRSAYARYLTRFGSVAHLSAMALCRDADGDSVSDAVPGAVLDMPGADGASGILTDGNLVDGAIIGATDSSTATFSLGRMAYVDCAYLAVGNTPTTIALDICVSVPDTSVAGPIWQSIGSGQVEPTSGSEILVPVRKTARDVRIRMYPAKTSTFTCDLREFDLRGASVCGADSVVLDRVAPELSLASLQPGVTSDHYTTLTGVAADSLSGVLSLEWRSEGPNPQAWTTLSTYTWPSYSEPYELAVSGLSNGSHTFSVSATDRAGNVSTSTVSLLVDDEAPLVASLSPTSVTWHASGTSMTWTSTDGDVAASPGVLSHRVFRTDTWTTASTSSGASAWDEGEYFLEAWHVDLVGNVGASSHTHFGLDFTAPEIALRDVIPSVQGVSEMTILGSAWDNGESGITSVSYSVSGGDWAPVALLTADPSDATSVSFTLDLTGLDEGEYTVSAQASDLAGNASAVAQVSFTLDHTGPPVASLSPTSVTWHASGTSMTWTSTDGDVAASPGVLSHRVFRTDTWTTASTSSGASAWDEGEYFLEAWHVDLVGNVGASSHTHFGLDFTAPEIALRDVIPSVQGVSEMTILGSAWDNGESGITSVSYSVSGGDWAPVALLTADPSDATSVSFTLDLTGLDEGEYTVSAQASDLAGNASAVAQVSFTLDHTGPPVASLSPTSVTWHASGTSMTWTSTDGDVAASPGVLSHRVFRTDTWTTASTSSGASAWDEGEYFLEAWHVDLVGNVGASSHTHFGLDFTAPEIALRDVIPSVQGVSEMTILGSAWDNGESGITSVSYSVSGGDWAPVALLTADPSDATSVSFTLDLTGLDEGEYTVSAQASDLAGNASAVAQVSFTLDHTGPPVASLSPTSVTWHASGTSMTWTSTDGDVAASPGVLSHRVFRTDTWTTASTSSGASAWDEGEYFLEAWHVDLVGNVGASSHTHFGLDFTAPEIALRDVIPSVQGVSEMTILGSAWDNGESGITSVSYSVSGGDWAPVALLTADPSDATSVSFTLDLTGLDEGEYTVSAQASDLAGNASAVAQVSFTLDHTGPPVASLSPTSVTWHASGTSMTWTSTDGDVAASPGVLSHRVFRTDTWTTASTSSGASAWDEGEYFLEAWHVDLVGNVGASSHTHFGLDFTAPEIALRDVIPSVQGVSEMTILGSAWDNGESGITSVSYSVSGGDWAPVALLTADPSDATSVSFTLDLTGLDEGEYTVSAQASDLAGNASAVAQVSFTLDHTGPPVASLSPTSVTWHASGTSMTWTSTDGDVAASPGVLSHRVFRTDTWTTASTSSGASAWDEGEYFLEAWHVDLVGNVGASSHTHFGLDFTAPEIALRDVIPSVQGVSEMTILGSAWDNGESGITSVSYSVSGGEWTKVALLTADPSDATSVSFTLDLTGLDEGEYTVSAQASDLAGNASAVAQVSFTLDHTGPLLTVSIPSQDALVCGGVTLTAEASDAVAGMADVRVSTTYPALPEVWTTMSGSSGEYTSAWDTTQHADGALTLTFVARDTVGNATTQTVSVTVDNTPPVVVAVDAVSTSTSPQVVVSLTVNDTGGSGVDKVQYAINTTDEAEWTDIVIGGLPSESVSHDETITLGEGLQNIFVRAKDCASNCSSVAGTSVTVDSKAPQLTILQPAAQPSVSGRITVQVCVTDGGVGVATEAWSSLWTVAAWKTGPR